MPAKSLAQLRKMFALEKRGEVEPGTAKEMAHATKNIGKLPLHVKHAQGGEVRHYSSGGERYGMGMGGLTHKMAHGGHVDNYMHEDENEYDHGVPRERYEPETAMDYAHGGDVTCPACGHQFAHGGMAEEEHMVDENEADYAGGDSREFHGLRGHADEEGEHVRRFAHALRTHR
jgi:hypothetical protein